MPFQSIDVSEKPAYLIGIIGEDRFTNPDETAAIRKAIKEVVGFLKPDLDPNPDSDKESYWKNTLTDFVGKLPQCILTRDGQKTRTREPYNKAFKEWPRLKNTDIMVMTPLTPGASNAAAEEVRAHNVKVVGVLPVPRNEIAGAPVYGGQQLLNLNSRAHENNYIVIQLSKDVGKTNTDMVSNWADIANQAALVDEFRDRLTAAHEYIASYCHLLIDIRSEQVVGANELDKILDEASDVLRREGPRPGRLPTTDSLGMPHGGPLLRLTVTRDGQAVHVRPEFFQSNIVENAKPGNDSDADWQLGGLSLMTQIAANLDEFNRRVNTSPEKVQGELCSRLKYVGADGMPRCFCGDLEGTQLIRKLRRLASLRRGASDESAALSKGAGFTILVLFLVTGLAAIAFDFFAHWIPQSEQAAREASNGTTGPAEPHVAVASFAETSESADVGATAISRLLDSFGELVSRGLFGLVAILSAIFALGWFVYQRAQHRRERMHDYRAVAEGARVQFYWLLAGIGRSVSANYVDRQRNELDWIRGAIRSVSMPYEVARNQFLTLGTPGEDRKSRQINSLRAVLRGWVDDQKNYFKKTAHKYHDTLHFWHRLGNTFALAGLFCVGLLLFDLTKDGHMHWLNGKSGRFLYPAIGFTVGWILVCFVSEAIRDIPRWASVKGFSDLVKLLWSYRSPRKLVNIFVRTRESRNLDRDWTQSTSEMCLNFLWYLPLSIFIFLFSVGICLFLDEQTMSMPVSHHLTIVAAGGLLIFGAMSVAWTEKNLHSELLYQYNNMLGLFDHASRFLRREIEQLDDLPAGSDKLAVQLNLIQNAILELGREALGENSEWLILHRARPLEPVMAG